MQLDLSFNPLKDGAGDYLEKSPEPFYSFPIQFPKNDQSFWKIIKKDLKKQNIQLVAHSTNSNEAIIVIENQHYASHTQSIGRALRILSKYIPININNFKIVLSEVGIPITQFIFDRNEISSIIDAPNAVVIKKMAKVETAPKLIKGLELTKSIRI